jgi:hypothetical protein
MANRDTSRVSGNTRRGILYISRRKHFENYILFQHTHRICMIIVLILSISAILNSQNWSVVRIVSSHTVPNFWPWFHENCKLISSVLDKALRNRKTMNDLKASSWVLVNHFENICTYNRWLLFIKDRGLQNREKIAPKSNLNPVKFTIFWCNFVVLDLETIVSNQLKDCK